jgi:glucose-6-phosphate isomerase
MTRGHYHAKECAEVYVGLIGEGIMIMQTKNGDSTYLPLRPGFVVYVPPSWAHRTVNVGENILSFLFVYQSNSGHDYETIRQTGFAKIVLEDEGQPKVVDNPKFTKS